MSAVFDGIRPIPLEQWTRPAFTDLQVILAKIEELDKKLGQPDCQDPEKASALKRIEERLAAIEAKLAGNNE
jgi:hypothetical protein